MKFTSVTLLTVTLVHQASAFAPVSRRGTSFSPSKLDVAVTEDLLASSADADTVKTGMLPDLSGIALSGLKGQALSNLAEPTFPASGEVRSILPADCFEPDTLRSLGYLSVSLIGTALCEVVGVQMLNVLDPSNLFTWLVWGPCKLIGVLVVRCGEG